MVLSFLILVQAIAEAPAPIDLRKAVARPCPVAQSGEDIVVCGGKSQDYRLKPLPDRYVKPPSDPLTFRVPGGTGNVHAVQTYLPGATGQGVMATFTFPVGKRRKE